MTTNLQRIRQMDSEELADTLCDLVHPQYIKEIRRVFIRELTNWLEQESEE